jgi:hypothetical protein
VKIYKWTGDLPGNRIEYVVVFHAFRLRVRKDGSISAVPETWEPLRGKSSAWKQVYP